MQYLRIMASSNPATPDSPPTEVNIGVINPFALVEAIVGRRLDPTSPDTARVISDVLQTEYAELFDMRYCSVLFAGLKLNEREKRAERMGRHELRILTDEDMVTPDMSRIKKLGDLEHVGLKDILELQVQDAHIRSGKVRLALFPHMLGRTLSSSAVTEPLCEISTPFRGRKGREGEWVPPNCSWQDMAELSQQIQRMRLVIGEMGMGLDASGVSDVERAFAIRLGRQQIEQLQRPKGMSSDPIQGAIANSWLVAALFSVAWAEPYRIVRDHGFSVKPTDKSKKHMLVIRLYSKGGENDGPTSNIEVDSEIPINNSSGLPIYCQPSSRIGTLWPSLYEKAFAKWLTKDSSGHPDITRTSAVANGGDPVKAMAQINDGKPQYFFTKSRTATDLIGLVRTNSINFKTIHPMVAYTHATGSSSAAYNGCSMVANHAYSVLGWAPTPAGGSGNQYIVLRNPWGVTEPAGLTTYMGLIQPVDADAWSPANMVDPEGVFALDANAFKEYFACLGMAKLKTKNDE